MSEEKKKTNNKGIIILVVIAICLIGAIMNLLGLQGVLLGLAAISAVWLCICASQKKPKVVPVLLTVLLLAGAFFVPGKGVGSDDLINVLGKTQKEIAGDYGQPSGATYMEGHYAEGFSYYISSGRDKADTVQLRNGSRKLCGISIGDSRADAEKAAEKAGGKHMREQNGGATIISYEADAYSLDITVQNGIVSSVDAYAK